MAKKFKMRPKEEKLLSRAISAVGQAITGYTVNPEDGLVDFYHDGICISHFDAKNPSIKGRTTVSGWSVTVAHHNARDPYTPDGVDVIEVGITPSIVEAVRIAAAEAVANRVNRSIHSLRMNLAAEEYNAEKEGK